MDEAEFDKFAAEYEHQHAENIIVSGETPAFFAKYKVDDVAAALRGLGREPARMLDFGGGVGNSLGFFLLAPQRIAYRIFFPRVLRSLRSLERYLGRLPLGAQYYAHAIKAG